MGRYINMGIATSYVASIENIEKSLSSPFEQVTLSEDKIDEIGRQFSHGIYSFFRDYDRLIWTLREDIPITDLILLVQSFFDLNGWPDQLSEAKELLNKLE